MSSPPFAFRLRGVRAEVERRSVFEGVALDVGFRRTTVILGPGGSGKSTLLRVLAENSPAGPDPRMPDTEGTGEFHLPPPLFWAGDCECRLNVVHLMQQRPALRSRQVALELASAWKMPRDLQGMKAARARAAKVWRSVPGAWDQLRPLLNEYFEDLSEGRRRLMDLTLVAAGKPECILLDEPTAEQEPADEEFTVQLLQSLRGRCTLVVVTHNLRVARLIADDLVLVIDGKVTEAGPLQQVVSAPQHPRTEYFLRMGC